MAEKEMPTWICTIVSKLSAMFSLNEWRIDLYPENAYERPSGNEGCDGLASFNVNYRTAKIFFDRDIDPDEKGLELVAHEVLHLVFADMHAAINDIVQFVPDKKQRETLAEIYDRVEEQTITRLARGMARDFDMKVWLEPKAEKINLAAGDGGNAWLYTGRTIDNGSY